MDNSNTFPIGNAAQRRQGGHVAVAATTQGNATAALLAGSAVIDGQALADAVRTQNSAAAGAQNARVGNPDQTIEYNNLGFRPTKLTIFNGPGRTCAKGEEHKVIPPDAPSALTKYLHLKPDCCSDTFSRCLDKAKREGRNRSKLLYLSYVEGDAGEVSYVKNGKVWTLKGKILSGACYLNYPASLTVGDVTYPLITPPLGKGYFRFLGEQMLLIADSKI